ncbi:MAG: enoyl-CoA hydratase [Ectothiorhodospiraceae bacterium]|jgi:enoyl-CoA hydratase/carnithine racemase
MSSVQAETQEERPILVSVENGVATLILNRPRQYNSLTIAMLEELRRQLTALGEDQDVRVIVIEARGKAFSAGHDLREVRSSESRDFHDRLFAACSEMMLTINRVPQPVIAKVQGLATGAGCQLVAACDLAIASDDARLATSGINVGLFCSTPSVAVSRNVSTKRAMEMLLTGDFIDADTAAEIGLINRAVSADALDGEVAELAAKIAAKAPTALRMGKQMFYRQLGMVLPEAYRYASSVMTENLAAEDAREGIDAFLEKREPRWRRS